MGLIAWLEDLAAACRIEPSEMTTRRYLKSLECWHLTPEQWEELSDRAVLRFARFPAIAELHDITCELREQARSEANSEWIAKTGADWSRCQTEGDGAGSLHAGLGGSP